VGAAGLGKLSLPGGIDNRVYPTKSARNQAEISRNPAAARRLRLQYLARRLHGLGEKPLFHFLDEVERGEPLCPHLERYAALPADFIKANGGDRFAMPLFVIDGGRTR
jgi:hypothetical protein